MFLFLFRNSFRFYGTIFFNQNFTYDSYLSKGKITINFLIYR
jgi:hypothetical protein